MNKDEIIAILDEKIAEFDKDFEYTDRYKYCKKKFSGKISYNSFDILKYNISDIVICYHLVHTNGDMDEILKDFKPLVSVMGSFDSDSLDELNKLCINGRVSSIKDFLIRHVANSVKNIIIDTKNNKTDTKSNKMFTKKDIVDTDNKIETKKIDLLKKISDESTNSASGINYFVFLYKNYRDYLLSILGIYLSYHFNLEVKKIFKDNFRNKTTRKAMEIVNSDNRYKDGIFAYNDIANYILEQDNNKRAYDKNKAKNKRCLKNAKNKLLQVKDNEEILDYKDIVDGIEDLDLKKEILLYIKEHNCKYIESLDKQIEHYIGSEYFKYLIVLNQTKISYDGDLSIFSYLDLNDFEFIINCLKQISLDNDSIISILKDTCIENVINIKDFMNKGILSYDFIYNNLDIFQKNSIKLNKISENINYFQNRDINPYIFRNNPYVLLQNIELNKNVLDILEEYNLISSLKNTSNIMFLNDRYLDTKIDCLLELGFEKYLEDDLRLLNYNNYNRLKLLKTLGVLFESVDDIVKVLETDRFMIEDNSIEDYLPNSNIIMDKVLLDSSLLNNFNYTSRTYKIGDTILSKRRINKMLANGVELYDAIFNDNGYTSDEYSDITLSLVK